MKSNENESYLPPLVAKQFTSSLSDSDSSQKKQKTSELSQSLKDLSVLIPLQSAFEDPPLPSLVDDPAQFVTLQWSSSYETPPPQKKQRTNPPPPPRKKGMVMY